MESPQHNLIDLPNKMRVYEHGDTSVIIKEIWHEKSYQNLRDVKTGDVVFDIGANQGIFSLYAASKGAKVYAVEPDPANFEVLQKNIALNGLDGIVIPIHCAVASESGFLTLYIPERDGKTLTGLITTTKTVSEQYADMDITAWRECQVKALRLSELFEQHKITRVDLLKIDCEGAELDILKGGDLEDFKIVRHIVMETHAGYSESVLYKKVQSLGFQVVSYQKISGVYATGYLWAESLQTAQETPYEKPVAIAHLSEDTALGATIVVDASNSFSTDPHNSELEYECFLNGQKMQSIAPHSFTAPVEQKNLNTVVLKVTQGKSSNSCELNFWAFDKNYGRDISTTPIPMTFTSDKEIQINGTQHFLLPGSELPKSWECRYVYLSVKIHEWSVFDQSDVRFLFNGDEYRMPAQQKTFEFPYFPVGTDFCFAIQTDQPVDMTLRCYALDKEMQKAADDIDLGGSEHFLLAQQGQKYRCHANSKSTFEFEFDYGNWVPNCVKFGVGVSNHSGNVTELTGQINVEGNTQSLNGWYQELKFTPPFASSKIKLELSVPLPRDYVVAWWPE